MSETDSNCEKDREESCTEMRWMTLRGRMALRIIRRMIQYLSALETENLSCEKIKELQPPEIWPQVIRGYLLADWVFEDALCYYMTHLDERLPLGVALHEFFEVFGRMSRDREGVMRAKRLLINACKNIHGQAENRFNDQFLNLAMVGTIPEYSEWMPRRSRRRMDRNIEEGMRLLTEAFADVERRARRRARRKRS